MESEKAPVSYTDLELLGNALDSRMGQLTDCQRVQTLHCYARLRYVRTAWIETLPRMMRPTELANWLRVKLLSVMSTLQRLHDRAHPPLQSLFSADHLPGFARLHTDALFLDQSSVVLQTLESLERDTLELAQIAIVIYAIGQLIPKDTAAPDVMQSFMQLVPDRCPEHSVMDILPSSIMLYSLARVNLKDDHWIRYLLAHTITHVQQSGNFPLERISMVLYSMAKLQYFDRLVVRRLMQEMSKPEHLQRFSAWDLSSLAYSLSRFHPPLKDDIVSLCQEIIRPRRLLVFSEQGLCLVIYSLGQMQCPASVMKPALEEALKPMRVVELTYKGLCMMLHGVSKLRHEQLSVVEEQRMALMALLSDCLKQMSDAAETLSPSATVSLIFGCMLGHDHLDDACVRDVLAAVASCIGRLGDAFMQELSLHEISILINGLSKLGCSDVHVWNIVRTYLNSRSIVPADLAPNAALAIDASMNKEAIVYSMLDEKQLHSLTESELVACLQQWNRLKQRHLSPAVLQECIKERRLERYTPHHLITLIAICTRHISNSEDRASILTPLMQRLKLPDVDHQGLIHLLHVLSRHRRKDPWMYILTSEINSRSGFYFSLKGTYLSMAIEAFANLEMTDRQILTPALQAVVAPGKIKILSDRSLVLLMHSCSRLNLQRSLVTAYIVQEIRKRSTVHALSLDLYSMMLCMMAKSGFLDDSVLNAALVRLETVRPKDIPPPALVNLVDAFTRVSPPPIDLATSLIHRLCEADVRLNDALMSQLLHSIGRLQLTDSTVKEYLGRFVQSKDVEMLDAMGLSGLVYAMAEADVADSVSGDRLCETALSSAIARAYTDGHLCTIMLRLHRFQLTNTGIDCVKQFLQIVESRVDDRSFDRSNFGQIVMGLGHLIQQHPHEMSFSEALMKLADDPLLDEMSINGLVGHIVAASTSPQSTIEFAKKTAHYIISKGIIYSCSPNELRSLEKASVLFDGSLAALLHLVEGALSFVDQPSIQSNE